ncbi:MAG: TRAP transporter substrate-binding protein, partial [Lachnospiraceae bacterium]|nr:TRAP transporter substrate-binding protein [Lachnospiraceae bacterium]
SECAEESSRYEREVWEERVKRSRETALANGVQVTTLSREETEKIRNLMQPIYEKYCGNYMDVLSRILNRH